MAKEKATILPNSLIESLYRNSLIVESTANRGVETLKPNEEKRQNLVIVSSPETSLNEKQSTFLQSILKACKIESNTVNIITSSCTDFGDYRQLRNTFGAEKCLLFGLEPTSINLPMNFPAFQIQSYEKQQYLWAPSLEEIEIDKSQKVTLWNSLQKLFLKNE